MSDSKNSRDPYNDLAAKIEDTIHTVSAAVGSAAWNLSGVWKEKGGAYLQNLHLKTETARPDMDSRPTREAPPAPRRKKLQIKRRGRSIRAAIVISAGLLLAACAMLEGLFHDPSPFEIIWTALFGAGGCAVLISGLRNNWLYRTACRYGRVIGSLPVYSISGLADVLHSSEKKVRRDLEHVIEKNYFGKQAFLDYAGDRVVIDPKEAEKVAEQRPVENVAPTDEPADEYDVWLQRIKEAGDKIEDSAVHFCVNRIHLYAERIFFFIRKHPEDVGQIRTFMNYYLPMTRKLLQSYNMLEEAGVAGENMRSTKQSIEETLETLAGAYRQQLDNLYAAQAMDISADIDVLEQMLRRDGLNSEESFSSGTGTETAAGEKGTL